MIVIRNNIIPLPGYKAITLWPFIFTRTELSDEDLLHEKIHGRQQVEMLLVGFYLWYLVEWLIRSIQHWSFHQGYHNISFEREAYYNEPFKDYLKYRRFWEFLEYINDETY